MSSCSEDQDTSEDVRNGSVEIGIQCELIVYDPAAISVSVTGVGKSHFDSLLMTQVTNDVWQVRLYLPIGKHTGSINVQHHATAAQELTAIPDSWDAAFKVPVMNHNGQEQANLRVSLHNNPHPTTHRETHCLYHIIKKSVSFIA